MMIVPDAKPTATQCPEGEHAKHRTVLLCVDVTWKVIVLF